MILPKLAAFAGAFGEVNLEFQGSSVVYPRAGPVGICMISWNEELDGGIELRSSAGSGRAFSCARAATRSTLTSDLV